MTSPLRTIAEFDALPDKSLVIIIERHGPLRRERLLYRKYSGQWVKLDPTDGHNGEKPVTSTYLHDLIGGPGFADAGIALHLAGGEVVSASQMDELPRLTVVQVASDPHPYIYLGESQWLYMDPADPEDGALPDHTSQFVAWNRPVTVLYRPGDEQQVRSAPVSETAQAYIAEYGSMPTTPAERERYTAFKFGFMRGQRAGTSATFARVARYIKEKA